MPKTFNEVHRYMMAHLLDDVRTGDEFKHRGLHITLFPWFQSIKPQALASFIESMYIAVNSERSLPENFTVDSLCLVRHDGAHKAIVGAERLHEKVAQ